MKSRYILPLMLLHFLPGFWMHRARSQEFSPPAYMDSAGTPGGYLLEHLDRYITPEYERRFDELRAVQRSGYTKIVMGLLQRDVIQTLVDYLRMNLQIDQSLNHDPVYYPSQKVAWFELPFDWSYPADPWKNPKWRK